MAIRLDPRDEFALMTLGRADALSAVWLASVVRHGGVHTKAQAEVRDE
jgi:hypothetical protein